MSSLWLDSPGLDRKYMRVDDLVGGSGNDTVVVGAGLTGLVTALLLARAGASVLVIEARYPGAVTTGNTTAKLSLLQGTALSELRRQHSLKVVRAYVEANREGQAWLLRYLQSRGVPFQIRDAYTFATTSGGADQLVAEMSVARAAGLDVESTRETGLPFAVAGSLRLAGQAQFHPMEVVDALAADLREHGGRIVHGVRVTGVGRADPLTVTTDRGQVRADTVVLATGTPILDRGLYFAKVRAMRSYAAALRLPEGLSPPPGMYLSAESPTRSLRDYPAADGELLLVGGFGHQAGRSPSPRANLDQLLGWAQANFPGAVPTHTWSAQDYQSTNLMPAFGRLPRGRGKILFATGYNKWGMSNAVAAALDVAADILGGQMSWARTIQHRAPSPRGAAAAVAHNADAAAQTFRDRSSLARKQPPVTELTQPPEGTGVTGLYRRKPAAVSTQEGAVCRLSAVCTHLGGIVHWNDAEKSWDCPLHGSRFSATGKVLEGPAKHDLPTLGG